MGIDYSYDSLIIYTGKKEVIRIPAKAAFEIKTRKIVAFAHEAITLAEKIPGKYMCRSALRIGPEASAGLFVDVMKKILGNGIFRRPEIAVSLPAPEIEFGREYLDKASMEVGVRSVRFYDRRLCEAWGAGVDIAKDCVSMVVFLEDDSIEIAVIRMKEVIYEKKIAVGQRFAQQAVKKYFERSHKVVVGFQTTEYLKKRLSLKYALDDTLTIEAREAGSSIKKEISVSGLRAFDIFGDLYKEIAGSVQEVLEEVPQDVSLDIRERGILLAGTQAVLPGLDNFLEYMTGVHCVSIGEDSLAARGAFLFPEGESYR